MGSNHYSGGFLILGNVKALVLDEGMDLLNGDDVLRKLQIHPDNLYEKRASGEIEELNLLYLE